MTTTEKMFLAWVLLVLLYFVSPNGNDMTTTQWIHYILGNIAIIGFAVTKSKE